MSVFKHLRVLMEFPEFPGSPGGRRQATPLISAFTHFSQREYSTATMQNYSIRHFYQAKNSHAHRLNTLDP